MEVVGGWEPKLLLVLRSYIVSCLLSPCLMNQVVQFASSIIFPLCIHMLLISQYLASHGDDYFGT
jgi:hypothetical protein